MPAINDKAERIKQLTFNGKPIDPNATFLVATNNYRAWRQVCRRTATNISPSLRRMRTVRYWRPISAPKPNGTARYTPQADNNWRLATFSSKQPLDIRFETSPSDKATAFIRARSIFDDRRGQ